MIIREINLQGFGRFTDDFKLTFGDSDIQIIVGKNESGKTTLMHGILAVLFGLKENEKRRMKSWFGNGASTGYLILEINKNKYIIERDFESDIINCAYFEGKKLIPVFSEHDTKTDDQNREYLSLLRSLIPIADEQVFKNTTFITQEQMRVTLPEGIKTLLNGAGDKKYNDLLEQLKNDYFMLTNDGAAIKESSFEGTALIENLKEKYTKKQKQLSDLNTFLQGYQDNNKKIIDLKKKLTEIDNNLEQKRDYLPLIREFSSIVYTQNKIKKTSRIFEQQQLEKFSLEKEIELIHEEIEKDFSDIKEFDALKLESDFKHYNEIASTNQRLEKELRHTLKEIDNKYKIIEKKFYKYDNIEGDVGGDLKLLRELKKEQEIQLKNNKLLKKQLEITKKKVKGSKNIALLISLGFGVVVFITLYLINFDILYDTISAVAAVLFALLLARLLFLDRDIREYNITKSEFDGLNRELWEKNKKISALQNKYFQVKTDEEILNHLHQYDLYLYEKEELKELETAKKVLLKQLNDPFVQKDLYNFEKKYKQKIKMEDTELESRINKYKKLSNAIQSKSDLLKKYKDKENSEDEERDLINQIEILKTRKNELTDQNPQFIKFEKNQRLLEREIKQAERVISDLSEQKIKTEKEIHMLQIEISKLEDVSDYNAAHLEQDLALLKSKIDKNERNKNNLTEAIVLLKQSLSDIHYSNHNTIASELKSLFYSITDRNDLDINLNEDFVLSVRVNNKEIDINQLSLGTRDQLYLALRIAFSNAISEQVYLPFFLDDPFVNCDQDRLENILKILKEVAKKHQLVLFTLDEKYRKWSSDYFDLNKIS